MSEEKKYWFRTKRYGWGWGLPITWQGRAVYFHYFALVAFSLTLPCDRITPATKPFMRCCSSVL
jgi:hypothetical protein